MSYFVYIVRCADDTFYTGSASDIDRRVSMHNKGKGAKYTRSRLPVAVVYREACAGKSEALSREYHLKQLSHSEKERLCMQWQTRS